MIRRAAFGRLLASQRGAVAAEFMIAFPVMMLAYMCFLQMAQVYTAGIVMRHATVMTARYASVSYPNPFIPHAADRAGGGGGALSWRDAATYALGPWKTYVRVAAAEVRTSSDTDPWADLQTKVDYEFACNVAIAKLVVCKNSTISRSVRIQSPLHGARYVL